MARKLIFREYVEARELIEASLRSKEFYGDDDSLERMQLAAIKEIFDYIKNDVSWVGQERSRKKVLTFIKNRCDYEKTKDELSVKSKNSLEASMSYLSKKLAAKIGVNTIELIIRGKVKEAIIQFRAGTGKLNPNDYIIDGLIDYLPKPNNPYTSLEECKKELKFLLTFTKFNLERIVNTCSKDKFSYLIYILTSTDSIVAYERRILYRLLRGNYRENEDGSSSNLDFQIEKAFEDLLVKDFR